MKWLSDFLKKNKLGAIEKAAKAILGILIPILAPALKQATNTLWDVSKEAVTAAESQGQSGDEKFEIAFKYVAEGMGQVSKVLLSVAIELAVSFLKSKLKLEAENQ